MSNEVTNVSVESLQKDLMIARQEKEIYELKLNLQKIQTQKASRLEDSLFSPELYQHYQKVSEMLAKSTVIPTAYRDKPSDIFVAMAMGYQLGFPVEQALQDIAVINGKPSIYGDGLLAICINHSECEGISEQPIYDGNTVVGYCCTVRRKGHDAHSQTFTLDDATRAKLLGKQGPWTSNPNRMLQMRARAFALRDKFADALRGMRCAEEVMDEVIGSEIIEGTVTPEAETQTERLKKMLNRDEKPQEAEEVKASEETKISNTAPASQDQLDKIDIVMGDKQFDDARRKKALDYFKVSALTELTQAQAELLMMQLERVK